jgi:hypothetical protein
VIHQTLTREVATHIRPTKHSVQKRESIPFLTARIKVVLGTAAYVAVFQWAYATVLTRTYAYEGFVYRKDPAIIATTWVLALVPSCWMPSRLSRPSQLVYWFFYLVVVIPVAVVTIHSYPGDAQSGIRVAIWIVSAFAVLGLIYSAPLARIPQYRLETYRWWISIFSLSAIFYGLIFSALGLHLRFAPISDIYVVRSQYERTLHNASIFVSYAVDWQAFVLNPLMIVLGLISRRKLITAIGVIGQLSIYSFTGFRTVLFSTILLVLLFFVCRSPPRFGLRMLLVWTAAVAGSTALYLSSGSLLLCSLIGERLTGLPGLLTAFYFSFFSRHPKMMLSHSILRGFFDNPYGLEPPTIIGTMYFPSWGAYANANFWADGFANFGIWGVFTFTAILGVVFWFYDSITVDRDLRLAALMLAMPAISLANTGLFTSLLTHGVGFACLVMYCLPNQIQVPAMRGRARLQYYAAGRMQRS